MENTPFPAGSRIIAYLRDSGGSDQDLSVTQQEESIGQWCKVNGYYLTRIFKDLAKSGTRVAGRTQFLEMVSYLNNHIQEKGIVLWELSRFSRDYNDAQFYLADIRRQGYIIHSMTDNIPPGLDGQMLKSMKLWMNAKFIEDLRKNTKRGLHHVINNYHAYVGSNIPAGYKRKQIKIGTRRSRDTHGEEVPHIISVLEIDPETAPSVKRAFEMRAAGATYDEIDQELKLYKCLMSYHDLLKNTKYMGRWRGMDDYCTPIIDEALFNQAQAVNKQHAQRYGVNHPRVIRSRFILTGILFCEKCGSLMYAHSTKNKNGHEWDYYRCSKYKEHKCDNHLVPKEKIERLVIYAVENRILQPDLLQDAYDNFHKNREKRSKHKLAERDKIEKEIKQNKIRTENVLSAIRDAGHSQALLNDLKYLEDELREFETELVEQESQPAPIIKQPMDEFIKGMKWAFDVAGNYEQKGKMIKSLITAIRITYEDKHVTGTLEFSIPGLDQTDPTIISL